MDHGRDFDLLKGFMPFNAGGKLIHFSPCCLRLFFFFVSFVNVTENHPGNKSQKNQIEIPYDDVNISHAFKPHDHLSAGFKPGDGTNKHDKTKLVVNISKPPVPHGGDEGLSRHMSNISSDSKGHRKAENIEHGSYHPGTPHTEKTTDNPNANTKNN